MGEAPALDVKVVEALLDKGRFDEAIELLVKETEENPAHEDARIRLAGAYERADITESAITTWRRLLTMSRNEANRREARRALCRLRRRLLDQADMADLSSATEQEDPFKIDMPPIDWEGLEVIEDTGYLPPIPGHQFEVPPFVHQTKHFTVYSTNERLSEVIGKRAEIYLDFMNNRLFGGRSWALRFPIVVYTTEDDYSQHGGPGGSAGATMRHITGKTEAILIHHLKPKGARQGGGREVWKYAIESILPHELTHAVINEFFAGRPTPKWMHEAVAGRFEQTRDHYGDAARQARRAASGEFFRMRDLFDQKGYPDPERVSLFYEQSAAVVLYLFEAGPEAMHVFLTELAEDNGHDAACAAALGIPEENAVEEFERRWVEWMKVRYIKDLDLTSDNTDTVEAAKSDHSVFLPWVNEMDTVDNLQEWRSIDLGSLESFAGVGQSKPVNRPAGDWSAEGGTLRCSMTGSDTGKPVYEGKPVYRSSLLAIRINEAAPLAVRCTVKCLAGPGEKNRWFGFAQLDAGLNDTRVEVLAPLRDNQPHELVCLWSDDLSIYLDGTCVGRYPAAFYVSGDAPDIDYPLALCAYGPVEIQDLRVAPITSFSDAPVVAEVKTQDKQPAKRRTDRRARRGRRVRKGP